MTAPTPAAAVPAFPTGGSGDGDSSVAARYRRVLGHFCTGVTVVTSVNDGEPVGLSCQAFAALSLDPPLVLFCPGHASSSGRRIQEAGHFCVNVLAHDQRDLARVFGVSAPDKFAGVPWTPTADGAPILDGALAWAACRIETVHRAGDHNLVIGRVTELGGCRDARPLLFYKGRYTGTAAVSPHEPPEVVDTLLAWPRHTDWI